MSEERIKNFEDRFLHQPTVRIAVGLALSAWRTYAVASVPDPREYLHRANHSVLTVLRKNESDLRLFWLGIYFAIELGHYDKANEMLDNAYSYRSFYKNNQPLNYKILHFLYAYLEIKQKRAKSAKKHMKTLENSSKVPALDAQHQLMMGMLHLGFYEYEEAYLCLSSSYEGGCRSPFLFATLFNYYRTATKAQTHIKSSLLLQTVQWALNHGADVEDIVVVYQDEILQSSQIELAERIYRQFPNQWILKELCTHYMQIPDYSEKAYAYYRDAERRQVYLPNLSYFLIRSAFENGSERIHHYTMTQYLRKSDGDIYLLVYVYHLLLTDPGLSDLAANKANEILKMAVHCLKSDIRGRHANSLYHFLWIKFKELNMKKGRDITKAEEILQDDLCKFEVIDPTNTVRYLYVNEWERQGIIEYEFPKDGSPLVIEAVGSGFRYMGLGAGRTKVLDVRLEIRRRVASAGANLYRYFYEMGDTRFEVRAYLAKSKEAEVDILQTILTGDTASAALKTQASVALGQLHFSKGNLPLALECYANADENALDNDLLEHMLTAYTQQGVHKEAAGLIERKGHRMSDKVLFNAMRPLSTPECAKWHPAITNMAYNLLIRTRYDKNMLDVVLNHFVGTQEEWLSLSQALNSVSVEDLRLDEIILKNAVWAHHFDEGTQRIFARANINDVKENSAKKDFIYYAIYEMIIKGTKPLGEAITALEKFYDEYTNDPLLAYGLSHFYLGHNISTAKSDGILQSALLSQKEDQILFPLFKRSKKLASTYIEKYQPFMYKTLPGKDVWLYYKVDGEEEWRSIPMEYWMFGLYLARVPHFYNENITYYFSEELATGSIATREEEVHNKEMFLFEDGEKVDDTQNDTFFTINNATIYEQMFRYEQVEEIIGGLVKDTKNVRSKLM